MNYIGLMSGTSMDGVDAVLVSFENEKIYLLASTSIEIPTEIKKSLSHLLREDFISLKLLGETDTQMGKLFSQAVLDLLKKANLTANDIIAIGSHGQTIYHHPLGDNPFTLQIGDPNVIAARTNITTIADFRRRDIALGGQGAPLVPAFHNYLLRDRTQDQDVVNIGGIANITYLPADQTKSIIGFDTGPGNTLLDLWHQQHQQTPIDLNGAWAASGKLHTELLNHLLDDPYFSKPSPKSTGREYFNLPWLEKKLIRFKKNITPEDIQNTLTELTAITIAQHIEPHAAHLWVCGGGVFNLYLMERLRAHCPNTRVQSTEKMDVNPKWVEAIAFAWLAKQTIEKKSGNLPSVTGATKQTILGGIYA
jgi:anhydro-N-acetylmuramic acid kinase